MILPELGMSNQEKQSIKTTLAVEQEPEVKTTITAEAQADMDAELIRYATGFSIDDIVEMPERTLTLIDDLSELAARLAAPVAAPVREWQDISTAPKDGTAILAFNCRHMAHAPVVVVWKTDPDIEMVGPEPHWADAATRSGTALYYNGNYFSHWMPLPALRAISGDTSK